MLNVDALSLAFAGAVFVAAVSPARAAGGPPPAVETNAAQNFALSAPRLDVGSQAYPRIGAFGAAEEGQIVNHVTRFRVPAYQERFGTGSSAYPEPR